MNSNSGLPLTGLANYRLDKDGRELMLSARTKLRVIGHKEEEGGYRAEGTAIPGCAAQGETFEELWQNLYEAVEGCLSVDVAPAQVPEHSRVLEIAV